MTLQYNFHKVTQAADVLEYRNEFFKQDREDLLINIKRQQTKAIPTDTTQEHEVLVPDTLRLLARQKLLEQRMETKMVALQCENAMLKAMVTESSRYQ